MKRILIFMALLLLGVTFSQVNNYTYNSSQHGSVPYSYTINVTIPPGNSLTSASLYFNSILLPSACSNVSTTYYCSLSDIPAPLVPANSTPINATWIVDYTDGITPVESNTTMPITLYYSVWATGINSSTIVAGGGPATVNVIYGNTAGITATLSGTAWLLGTSNSGTLTCAAGVCSGTITTPSVSSATLYQVYQVEANITLTSSYWGTTQNRVVRIENTLYYTAPNATMTNSGTVANQNNANDSSWTTYATYASGGMQYFNYTFTQLYYGNWTFKDFGATRNYTIPNDCIHEDKAISPVTSFRVQRTSANTFNYSCYNYSSETYSTITTTAYTASAFFYEQNVTRWQNNSLVKVVPFGLTSCATGVPFLNYSCWNEINGSSISCTYAQTFIVTSTSGGLSLIQSFSGTASAWQICFTPSTLEVNVSSTEQIGGGTYDTRFYYLFGVPTNSSTSYALQRYVGLASDTKLTFMNVKRAGNGVQGVYVYIQRLFVENDTLSTGGMGKTDSDGVAVSYLIPNDAFYRFIVYDADGTSVLYTSPTAQVACAASASYCTVALNIQTSVVDYWQVKNGITSSCTFNNATKVISCAWVVLDGTAHTMNFTIYNWTTASQKHVLYSQESTSSSGTMFYDLGNENTTGRYTYGLTVHSTSLILQAGEILFDALAAWGSDMVIAAIFIIIVLALGFSIAGPSAMVIGAYVGLIISTTLQFVHIGTPGLLAVGVVAAVIAYVMRS